MKYNQIVHIIVFLVVLFDAASPMAAQRVGSRGPRQEKLLNGLKVAMWSDSTSPRINLRVRIHAGAAFDQQGKEGMMALLAESFFPTSASRDYFSEDLGGGLEIRTGYDFIEIDATSDSANMLNMIDSVASAVSSPTLDKETTTTVKAAITARMLALEQQPGYVADRAAAKMLFGAFPYGRPILGTAESLASIDFVDLRFAYSRFFGADNASITLTGNFSSDTTFRAIRRYFGGWLKADKKVPSTFRQPDPPTLTMRFIESPQPESAEIRFMLRGFARGSQDFIASEILADILQQRMRGKSPPEHRSEVFARNDAFILPGSITLGFTGIKNQPDSGNSTAPPKFEANDIVAQSLSGAVTPEEFAASRQNVQNQLGSRDEAEVWLDADTYRLTSPDAYRKALAAVSLADVRRAAEKLVAAPMVTVVVNTPKPKE